MTMKAAAFFALASASSSAAALPLDALARGQLVVMRDWLPRDLTDRLRADAYSLRENGAFKSSGLSNTAKGGITKQGFDRSDRAVVPITPDLGGDLKARAAFATRLASVQNELCRDRRPGLVCAEQYYSVASGGSTLARHMDERHEELKGARGWSGPIRRSVSWLVYLCEPGWDEPDGPGAGGYLRAFVRDGECAAGGGARCGAHEGNLQVGWLRAEGAGSMSAEPVYLDAWVPVELSGYDQMPKEEKQLTPRYTSLAALYRVVGAGAGSGRTGATLGAQREYVSKAVEGGGAHTVDDALATMGDAHRRRFASVDVPKDATGPPDGAYEASVAPLGGTLLLFDSVAVPHEVLATTAGERWAMAGWFHEPQQEVPSWLSSYG